MKNKKQVVPNIKITTTTWSHPLPHNKWFISETLWGGEVGSVGYTLVQKGEPRYKQVGSYKVDIDGFFRVVPSKKNKKIPNPHERHDK